MATSCNKCGRKVGGFSNYGNPTTPLCFDCFSAQADNKKMNSPPQSAKQSASISIDYYILGLFIGIPIILSFFLQNPAFLGPVVAILLGSYVILKKPFSSKGKIKPKTEKILGYVFISLIFIADFLEIFRDFLIRPK